MTRHAKRRKVEWPCGVCNLESKADCLYCETCERWFHKKCENVNTQNFKLFATTPEAYICVKCRSNGVGFDYSQGLKRLKKVSTP